MYTYQWKHYDQLSKKELHDILTLRQQVFVVEQQCAYLDADALDCKSFHLFAQSKTKGDSTILAYLRVISPHKDSHKCTIGRVLTRQSERGIGLATNIMREAFKLISIELPCTSINISAQQHLEEFYTSLGFVTASEPYEEDGIFHIAMTKL